MTRRRGFVGLLVGSVVVLGGLLSLQTRSVRVPVGPSAPAPSLYGFMGAGDAALPYAANRLLVQIRDTAMAPTLEAIPKDKDRQAPQLKTGYFSVDVLIASAGITDISRPYDGHRNPHKAAVAGVDRWFMFHFGSAPDLVALADALAAQPEVEAVSLDWRAWPATSPSDPGFAANWGHENRGQLPAFNWNVSHTHSGAGTGTVGFDADVPEAWQLTQGYGSPDVVIAIIDSGVDLDHPDLRLVAGYDFGDDDAIPDDDAEGAGHGTCCAGIAAALNNGIGAVGVAPGCSIMPLKVSGSDGIMYFSAVQQALYYAADHGADVVSLSIGAPIKTDPATEAALRYADQAGVVLVAATGNGNGSELTYPASSPYVIAVGAASPGGDRKRSSSALHELNRGVAADPNGCTCDGERWWGSSYGSDRQDDADAVDLLGPTILPTCDIVGVGGYSDDDVEPFFNGTSCAAPYVAGVAALVLSAFPEHTPAQVREALVTSARDVIGDESGPGWDRYAGFGLVNAQAAILGLTPPQPPTEPVVVAATAMLGQNQPNPFNPITRISFDLPRDGSVRLSVFNARGQLVARLVEGHLPAGSHFATWDAAGHPSGIYVYRLEAPGIDETRKMTLLR